MLNINLIRIILKSSLLIYILSNVRLQFKLTETTIQCTYNCWKVFQKLSSWIKLVNFVYLPYFIIKKKKNLQKNGYKLNKSLKHPKVGIDFKKCTWTLDSLL